MTNAAFELTLDRDGHWQLRLNNELHHAVVVVRAFPIGAPDEAVSILSAEGHELLWLPEPLQLAKAQKEAVLAALQAREFMPEIKRVDAVSSFTTPSTWSVQTHRGFTQFVLRGEEDIRHPVPPRLWWCCGCCAAPCIPAARGRQWMRASDPMPPC